MQQHDLLVHQREQRSRDAIIQPGTDFQNPVPQIVNQRLAERLGVLHRQNIGANDLAIVFGQFFQPCSHRFIAGGRLEKDDFERAFSFHLLGSVSEVIRMSSGLSTGRILSG